MFKLGEIRDAEMLHQKARLGRADSAQSQHLSQLARDALAQRSQVVAAAGAQQLADAVNRALANTAHRLQRAFFQHCGCRLG
jgi:small-conductance mechanosensitive channel